MGFFHHDKGPEWVDDESVVLQRGTDEKTLGMDHIQTIRMDLRLQQTHPWNAKDFTRVQLSRLAFAVALDRTSEIVVEDAGKTEANRTRVTKDVGAFALGLSKQAKRQFTDAQSMAPTQLQNLVFGESTVDELNPERQLPFWPYSAAFTEIPEWQSNDITAAVTPAFLRGITRASQELLDSAEGDIREIARPNAIATVPPELAATPDVLGDIMRDARVHLENAGNLVSLTTAKLSPDIEEAAYQDVHDGLVKAMFAFTATYGSPQILGMDFAPNSPGTSS